MLPLPFEPVHHNEVIPAKSGDVNLVTHRVPIQVSGHSFHWLKPKIKIHLANPDIALMHMMPGQMVSRVANP